jgi:ribulose-5-phosphate 4-epimerase/fuculose-1-phosphate aldolase
MLDEEDAVVDNHGRITFGDPDLEEVVDALLAVRQVARISSGRLFPFRARRTPTC